MLDLHTTHLAGQAVVRARGSMTVGDADVLRDYLRRRVDAGDLSLVVDLHTLRDVSSDLGLVVASAAEEAVGLGAAVVVVGPETLRAAVVQARPNVRVSESLDAAVGALAPPLAADRGHLHANNPNQPPIAFGA